MDDYPGALVPWAATVSPGPWMYTGGLENRPGLVNRLARGRPLWGNPAEVLKRARSPFFVAELLDRESLPCPRVRRCLDGRADSGRWLIKPLAGTGGVGVGIWNPKAGAVLSPRAIYYQEHIDGQSCAALYLGNGQQAILLGITRQLVGESWLWAGPFCYCGSIGPLKLAPASLTAFERLGAVLARGCGLRGLFGVDCILREGLPWPVEVNPRYTAAVEVLEYATRLPAFFLHGSVFDSAIAMQTPAPPSSPACVGKAILFARGALTFPADGPWQVALTQQRPLDAMPAFADIPHPGEPIGPGQPILTFFAQESSPQACLESLQQTAANLDQWLFSR
jgi:predicted ATP-grasp superfamily ATP-dependent carboligase